MRENLSFVDFAVGDGDDVASIDVANLSGLEANDDDLALDVIVFNGVANGKIVVRNDGGATNNVFECVLDGETKDSAGDADAGEKGRNVDVVDLEDDKNSNENEDVAKNTVCELEISRGTRADIEAGGFVFFVEEDTGETAIENKANNNDKD